MPRGSALAAGLAACLLACAPVGARAGTIADGNFTDSCRYSHSLADDPIVSFGQPGASHLHDFFGNASTNAFSTLSELELAQTTCGRPEDRSAYWVPALFAPDGTQHPATVVRVYYTASQRTSGIVRPFPLGFRMIARDTKRRNEFLPPDPKIIRWGCITGSLVRGKSRPWCDEGGLRLTVVFPECWDGRPDSADHSSHVAFAERRREGGFTCPASHPYLMPRLTLFVDYLTPGGRRFRLASGGQFSAHADYLNVFDEREQRLLVDECLNAGRKCLSSRPAPSRR